MIEKLQAMLDDGVARGVAPAMVLHLWQGSEAGCRLSAGAAEPDTYFDLASLTKPLATALLAFDLAADGVLPLEATLGQVWGDVTPPDKRPISVAHLLCHASGLPAHRPFYQALEKLAAPSARRGLLKAMLLNEPLEAPPGARAVYSDLGYMLLGLLLEEAAGVLLETAVAQTHARLGLSDAPRFNPTGGPAPIALSRIAPCGPLPGRPLIHGQVEDENAFAMGGVAGHSGLFGASAQVVALMAAMARLTAGEGPWPAQIVAPLFHVDAATPGSTRTAGLDTPCGPESAAGPNAPAGVVGHLGFTGVSMWLHPASRRGVVLLTNRVALGRANDAIGPFRRQVHQLAWRALGETS
ncbi:beta-lactamase [Desulfarculus baarsii DSM 2075]|uniref:Beta-lactamase n=1 Tax=Desulfarculus baarsii (strain ATCC 33931 / DSM 2075 / LMG 7858 / VKM B-1802 / 2st14) TaxID=644282 RepID=E1QF05_DESB2|nr:serine hydrolase domain-containing protein [Desulfarculus baarsii]ADK84141.1 beta-lactamase [Desulfarculus baarsii DSM 2075]